MFLTGIILSVILFVTQHYYILKNNAIHQQQRHGPPNHHPSSSHRQPLENKRQSISPTKSSFQNTTNNKSIPPSNNTTNPTIAYTITITSCPTTHTFQIIDAAAVLSHSLRLINSTYPYELYAIVPNTTNTTLSQHYQRCIHPLRHLGYTILHRPLPVTLDELPPSSFLFRHVSNDGCCGEMEWLKLWVYTLVEHPIVVLLDTDVLVLNNGLDYLYDVMLGKVTMGRVYVHNNEEEERLIKIGSSSSSVDAFFTRDYNMRVRNEDDGDLKIWNNTHRPPAGMQGGFLVVKPSLKVFEELKDIIRTADFRDGTGWGGKGYWFYGAMTFQGIIPYYYDSVVAASSSSTTVVELNRCYYNNMVDNPMDEPTINDTLHGKCLDERPTCQDCRRVPMDQIITAHFTICEKPWKCHPHEDDRVQNRLCRRLVHEWMRVRGDLEYNVWKMERSAFYFGYADVRHFLGFCRFLYDFEGYVPMRLPFRDD